MICCLSKCNWNYCCANYLTKIAYYVSPLNCMSSTSFCDEDDDNFPIYLKNGIKNSLRRVQIELSYAINPTKLNSLRHYDLYAIAFEMSYFLHRNCWYSPFEYIYLYIKRTVWTRTYSCKHNKHYSWQALYSFVIFGSNAYHPAICQKHKWSEKLSLKRKIKWKNVNLMVYAA